VHNVLRILLAAAGIFFAEFIAYKISDSSQCTKDYCPFKYKFHLLPPGLFNVLLLGAL
jgi:hypothetical protein